MMSKKMAELEDDFREFKAHTERRFVSLDMSIRAYRLEEDQRHEEEDQRHEERIRRYDELKNLLLSLIHKSSSPVQSSRPITTKVPTKPTECVSSYGDFGCLSPNNMTDFEEDEKVFENTRSVTKEDKDEFTSENVGSRKYRFQQTQQGNLFEQFLTITQDGTARAYVALFEKLAGQLVGVSEQVLEATFIKGLKSDLRASVRVMHPEGLNHAMILAVTIEENKGFDIGARGGGSYRSGGTTSNFSGYKNNTTSSTRTLLSTASTGNKGGISTGRVSQFKRLTEAELADKRSKGLCFKCDQKFGPGHVCVSRSLQVLLVDEEEEYEEEDGEELKMATDHVHLDMVEVSLNSVMGFTPNRTMKLRGKIGDREVAVLIDCGATHNFISSKIVEELRLAVSDSGTFNVTLGNGETTRSKGICKGLVVVFPEIQVFEDFLPLELGSTDAILGIKWLQTLGDVKMNWKLLTMKFMVGLGEVTLCGDPSLCRSKLSLKAMEKSLTANAECYLVELKELDAHKSSHQGVNTEPFKKLLLQFEDVFNMPFGLPPTRAHEHAINLREGTTPVSIRPYRYPQVQKDEIEKLVREMLGSNYKRSGLEFYSIMIFGLQLEQHVLYGPLFEQRMIWDPGIRTMVAYTRDKEDQPSDMPKAFVLDDKTQPAAAEDLPNENNPGSGGCFRFNIGGEQYRWFDMAAHSLTSENDCLDVNPPPYGSSGPLLYQQSYYLDLVPSQLPSDVNKLNDTQRKRWGYYFYYPVENKIFVARNADFFERSLTLQEASGSHTLHGAREAAYILGINITWKTSSKRRSVPMQENPNLSKARGENTPNEVNCMQRVPYASAIRSIISSEYITVVEDSMEVVSMRKFIDGLGNVVPTNKRPMKMLCDNTSAIAIANYLGIMKGARHYQRKYHYIREII
ncbi:putative mitochondrial protein [Tanacetum coccineum]